MSEPARALTAEQQRILDIDTEVSKINAVAGSGKTTTLLAYAASRPGERMLYLAYNRAMAEEVKLKAQQQGLANLRISTLHGMAWQQQGRQLTLGDELNEWQILEHYCPPELRHGEEGMLLAWLLRDLMVFYLNAAHRLVDDELLHLYCLMNQPQPHVMALLQTRSAVVLALLLQMLGDMKSGKTPAWHDFYLKLFQFSRRPLPYDVILLDEAQDSSAVMLAILERQPARKILVGDGFQQIYAFRFAINSLDRVHAPEFSLSQSFRFGDGLARHLSAQISEAYQLLGLTQRLQMRGSQKQTDYGWKPVWREGPKAVVSRSNLKLLDACLTHLEKGRSGLHFEGGYGSYSLMNGRVFSLLHLQEGKHEQVSDPLIRRFRHAGQVDDFARETQNQQLTQLMDLVRRYGKKLFHLDRQIKAALVDKADAQLVLSTTHRAKGQEYDHVSMTQGDFTTRDELRRQLRSEKKATPIARLREEVNIYYVAATRARSSIYLAPF
jgi:superfamily I DNA/RNA helicase